MKKKQRIGEGTLPICASKLSYMLKPFNLAIIKTNELLVIAEAVKPIAIAGVIGGEESAVTGTTTNVLIESAYFNPILIRRTAKKLGILTDYSYRFERGTDIKCLDFIANRVADLVSQFAGGNCLC